MDRLYELYDIENDGTFYVYELYNPIKDEVFYVGKGKNDRFSHRQSLSKRNTKEVDDNLIIELNKNGFSVNEIVRETGITRIIILKRLIKYNLPNNSKKEKHVDISLINNMLINGIEKYKICEEFNISISTLNRKLKNIKDEKEEDFL